MEISDMAKKKRNSPATSAGDMPVQFRPGHLLADLLDKFVGEWHISRNEVARRFTALAAHNLDSRHHNLICEYAERMYGANDFTDACQRVFIELQSADTARVKVDKPAMTEEERQLEVVSIVKTYALMHRDPENPEEEKQFVKVFNRTY